MIVFRSSSICEKSVKTCLEYFNGINHTSTKMSACPKSASVSNLKEQKIRVQESIKALINLSP